MAKDYPNNKGGAGRSMYGPFCTPMTGQVKSKPAMPKVLGGTTGNAATGKKK